MIQYTIAEVQKEQLPDFSFADREVLFSDDDILTRQTELYKAMVLGNINKLKSKITFMTTQGVKKIETTVWGLDEKEVSLKYGFCIPVHTILRVDVI